VDEVNVLEVEDVIALTVRATTRTARILKLKSFESRVRYFLPAVALVFRDRATNEHRVSFAISGRMSEEHERAFASSEGIRKSQRFAGLSKRGSVPKLRDVVGERIAREIPKPQSGSKVSGDVSIARQEVSEAERELSDAMSEDQRQRAEEALRNAESHLREAEARARSIPVRPLAVYEHPALLRHAINSATNRLLILSPWIRRSVVSRSMVKDIGCLLERGVTLHVGFGLGEVDGDASPRDRDAERELEDLAKKHKKFHLKRLGDTHAKVLVKDSEFFVISSFNWLSFQGDPNRTFREEWGTYVGISSQVDAFYNELLGRFGDPQAK
jgi:phosphatidylserine/phosphatidylglycerophosphate/cardiolipin synthase-like enzyme